MDSEILTIEEAAEMLKVSHEVMLNLLLTSEIPGRNIGGTWRTTKRALVSFVDGVPLQTACCPGETCCTNGAGRGCC